MYWSVFLIRFDVDKETCKAVVSIDSFIQQEVPDRMDTTVFATARRLEPTYLNGFFHHVNAMRLRNCYGAPQLEPGMHVVKTDFPISKDELERYIRALIHDPNEFKNFLRQSRVSI